jgi:hypothetical protein
MKTLKKVKKVIYAGLFLILSNGVCFSQNSAENDSLSFKRGSWSNQYYIGNQQISYDYFIKRLGDNSEQSVRMFTTGRNISIAGIAIGSVGAFCFGYDLGGRLAGAEGNTALLVGGGTVLIGGIILSYMGENKMKKALTLYQSNSVSFSISPARTGIGLCVNF